jgi:hypothetical protein
MGNGIISYRNNAISPQDLQRARSSVQEIPSMPDDAADEEAGQYLQIWLIPECGADTTVLSWRFVLLICWHILTPC